MNRRQFLLGTTALAAATALPGAFGRPESLWRVQSYDPASMTLVMALDDGPGSVSLTASLPQTPLPLAGYRFALRCA